MYMSTRLNLNVPDTTRQIIDRINMTEGFTITAQFVKGITLLECVLDAQKAGKEFRVYEKDGSYRVIEFLFP
jgi:hypothetical protein